ncbi:ABC transporter ATP-binding protein [Brachybacterium sp.]|jgi:ABC-2 type transport system ATP-binding protein|uniref:ABC transporter ATP-binding protein n=1 Tax=Brachybacterium sp. TaxID=1891286 RepID=UPI002ED45BEA
MSALPIEVTGLGKRFGDVTAVDEVSFAVHRGRITGFLGPNGAGKSTTLRILLGLVRADRGRALLGGRPFRELAAPSRTVGAVLDLASAHPATTARDHLRTYAALGGLPATRVQQVLEQVDAHEFADRRSGTYSTGMHRRLALATALLGDPEVLVLDEPTNGLDPAGIAWLRSFLGSFTDRGGTVLLSSHVLSEMQQAIDDVVLIDRGRIAWSGPLAELLGEEGSLESAFLSITGTGAPA